MLRLHGSFYVSGVPSEKVAEVRKAEKGIPFQASLISIYEVIQAGLLAASILKSN